MTPTSAPYTVLARRFRPQTFDDVVGQAHVGQAICNAIRSGRVAHAYLFTGARGVGKTSTARIFAKALNCPHAVDGVPCNECEICRGISTGGDVDVLEIDGASNRGIDDIRQLRANVNIRSMRSKYKVYIIDEVHMLTKEAFNALLKTLEEPPPNVKFVFCTTEPNKVPDTILSRCQRFDFGSIATESIAQRLSQIAEIEGIQVDSDAVELVARRAAGSMRDSQSLFDQLLAFGAEHITALDVHQLLGTAPDDRLVELFDALIDRDRRGALRLLDEALGRGVQLGPLGDQLLEYLRDLLVVAAGADEVSLSSVATSLRPTLHGQGERWGLQTITAAMQILAETKGKMQRVNYGRALIELALVRISLLEDLDDLGRLVRNLGSGSPAASPAPGRPAPLSGGGATRETSRPSEVLRQKLTGGPPRGSAPPAAAVPTIRSPETASEHASALTTEQPHPGNATRSVLSESVNPVEAEAAEEGLSAADEQTEPPVRHANVSPSATESGAGVPFTEEGREAFWAQLLEQSPDAIAHHLRNAKNLAIIGPNVAEIVFPRSYLFSMNYCRRPDVLKLLSERAQAMTGRAIEIRLRDEAGTGPATPAVTRKSREDEERLRPKAVEDDVFIQQATSIFGGAVVDVRRVLATTLQPASDEEE